jgi:hypothetical protein
MDDVTRFCNFDVEFGNSNGFYSGSRSGPYTKKTLKDKRPVNLHGDLARTELGINDNLKELGESSVLRQTKFSFYGGSKIFDLVSRFVVTTGSKSASINGRQITHCSSNIYHQYDVIDDSVVKIPVQNGTLVFRPLKSSRLEGFRQVLYLRDERKEDGNYVWIFHNRVIVIEDDATLILRCCHPIMEGVVPFERMIPRIVKKRFFRIRETTFPNCPFMVVGESTLSEGDCILLETRISLEGD